MLESIKIWWKFKKIRSAANTYHYHKEQLDEWTHRFIADTSKNQQKQHYHMIKHRQGMKECVRFLQYQEHVPAYQWIPVGAGMEIYLDAHVRAPEGEQIERRWN